MIIILQIVNRLRTIKYQYKTNYFFSFAGYHLPFEEPNKNTHHSGIAYPLVHMPNTT
jgi:hypothetical protein